MQASLKVLLISIGSYDWFSKELAMKEEMEQKKSTV